MEPYNNTPFTPGQLHPSTKYANMTFAEFTALLQNGDKEALEYLQQYKAKLSEIEETFNLSKGQK
jgi:hypothetical protein